jgi:hypothetical protein
LVIILNDYFNLFSTSSDFAAPVHRLDNLLALSPPFPDVIDIPHFVAASFPAVFADPRSVFSARQAAFPLRAYSARWWFLIGHLAVRYCAEKLFRCVSRIGCGLE